MMDYTDRHYRYMMRLLSKEVLLYSEMVTAEAIICGDRAKLLAFSEVERPLVLQLGGSVPKKLLDAAKIAEDWGYDEINLNVGCPSKRVRDGKFGACLMAEPDLVADIVGCMRLSVSLPVGVKHRIGIDGLDQFDDLCNFVKIVSLSGCDRFVVHARVAKLSGLDPKKNRTIPPLRYSDVYDLKKEFPDLVIEINGGIKALDEVAQHLKYVDGAMIGRAAYNDPYMFALIDERFFGYQHLEITREQVIESLISYFDFHHKLGVPIYSLVRHTFGLWRGCSGAKMWRRYFSSGQLSKISSIEEAFRAALKVVNDLKT
jgi:tRNA-dihydrouridine synthase A